MSDLERFDYIFWLGEDDDGVQEAIVVRDVADEEEARELVPEAVRARITASEEKPSAPHVSAHDLQLLAALIDRPEWTALRLVAEQRMHRQFRQLARMFATEGKELDYDRLQFQRGVFAGMKFVLDEPHKLLRPGRLERLLNEEEVND